MVNYVQYISIRDVWKNETSDFNEWLFKKENLEYLGIELGMDLLPFCKEKKINKGRVDIIAVNKVDDSYVLIENQIGRADHHHYGKIIEYIHSVKPKATIWIVNEWYPFHKNTIKMIEDLTKLFVVKIDLIRIANSPIGVKFTTLIEPSDWVKRVFIEKHAFPVIAKTSSPYSSTIQEYVTSFGYWFENALTNEVLAINEWIPKKVLLLSLSDFLKDTNLKMASSNAFNRLFKSYCSSNNFTFSARKSGGSEYYKIEKQGIQISAK